MLDDAGDGSPDDGPPDPTRMERVASEPGEVPPGRKLPLRRVTPASPTPDLLSVPAVVSDGEAGDGSPSLVQRGAGAVRWVWAFTRQHAAAVGVVLLGACLWAGYTASQASSTEVDLPEVTVSAPSPIAPSPIAEVVSASPTPSPVAMIEVHVIGGVRKPGVVSVPQGSRIEDVLTAAGGLAEDGDPAELNLAAPAVDGSQVVIGTKKAPRGEVRLDAGGSGPVAPAAGGAAPATMVSLNTATAAQLEALPGIGPVTAGKILAWRQEHGRFTSVEELQEISGIGPKTFAEIQPHVRI